MFIKSDTETSIAMSLITMIQTILLVSHFNMKASEIWMMFLDGFQYFKFNLRFLNVLFFKSYISNTDYYAIPSKMYYLFFEDKASWIWFFYFIIFFFIIVLMKLIRILILRTVKRNLSNNYSEEKFKENVLYRL